LVRFLRMCDIEPMSEDLAKQTGVLAGKSDHDDLVDVAVVEGAIRRGDAVVTSNVHSHPGGDGGRPRGAAHRIHLTSDTPRQRPVSQSLAESPTHPQPLHFFDP
jgi:hypothetical protein